MAQDEQSEYTPGVCNIGDAETQRRRNFGWFTLAISLLLLIILIWTKVSPWWRLLIFFPATMAASGFLQAHFHFCSGFARKGVFNFGSIGKVNRVTDQTSMQIDQRRGNQITFYAVLLGLAAAVICVLVHFI